MLKLWLTLLLVSNTVYARVLVLSASSELDLSGVRERTLQLISEKIPDLTFEFRTVPLPRGLAEANSGKIDGDAGRIRNLVELFPDQIVNLIRVKEPLYQLSIYAIHRKGETVELNPPEIGSARIAYLTGIVFLDAKFPKVNQVHVADERSGLKLLRQKKVDAYLKMAFDHTALDRVVQRMPDLTYRSQPYVTKNVFTYLHKKHLDLIPRIEKAIRDLRREGRLPPVLSLEEDIGDD